MATKPKSNRAELAREVWEEALRLRREFGWKQAKLNEYVATSPVGLRTMDELTRYVMAEEAEAIDPGLAVSIATGAASGINPFTDEIAGVLGALATRVPGSKTTAKEGYLRARDHFREIQRLSREAHPTAYGASELAGSVGTGIATAGATGLVPGIAAGAKFAPYATTGMKSLPAIARVGASSAVQGGVEALGRAEDLSPESLMGAGRAALESGAAGAGLGAAGRFARNIYSPDAYFIENQLAGAFPKGGVQRGLQEAMDPILATGRKPMLAEVGGEGMRFLGTRHRAGPRVLESARRKALGASESGLEEATAIKQTLGKGYDALKPLRVAGKEVDDILESPRVQKLLGEARAEGMLPASTNPRTFGTLHWLSGRLREKGNAEWNKIGKTGKPTGDRSKAVTWFKTADRIDSILEKRVPWFANLEKQYATASESERSVGQLVSTLSKVRPLSKPAPGEALKYAIREPLGLTTSKMRERAGKGIAETLYAPGGSAEELMSLVRALRQGWGSTIGVGGGAALAREQLRRRE